MATWLPDYLATLDIRDARDKADQDTITLYTQLADRCAELQRTTSTAEPPAAKSPTVTQTRIPTPLLGGRRASSPKIAGAPAGSGDAARLRIDLAGANRNAHDLTGQVQVLQTRVDSLAAQTQTQSDEASGLRATVARLEGERVTLVRRVRDRESELTEKARLVEGVQDEMVGLEMQVNVAEARALKLERENKELVERWMKRVGEEVEDMNKGSGWE